MKIIEYEGLKIQIEESDHIFRVNIISDQVDILINNELIFSQQGPEEWRYIPKELKEFIEAHQSSMEFTEENGEKILAIQIFRDELREGTMYFSNNTSLPLRVRFRLLIDVEDFANNYLMKAKGRDIEKRIVADKLSFFWESIQLKAAKYNYGFSYSKITEQKYYGFWDISFQKEQWDMENFNQFLKTIQNFKQELQQIELQYKLLEKLGF